MTIGGNQKGYPAKPKELRTIGFSISGAHVFDPRMTQMFLVAIHESELDEVHRECLNSTKLFLNLF
jgi:hypothetical protein